MTETDSTSMATGACEVWNDKAKSEVIGTQLCFGLWKPDKPVETNGCDSCFLREGGQGPGVTSVIHTIQTGWGRYYICLPTLSSWV